MAWLFSPEVLHIATCIVVPSFRRRIIYISAICVGCDQPLVNDIADVYLYSVLQHTGTVWRTA